MGFNQFVLFDIEEEPGFAGLLRKRKTNGMTELSSRLTEASGYGA